MLNVYFIFVAKPLARVSTHNYVILSFLLGNFFMQLVTHYVEIYIKNDVSRKTRIFHNLDWTKYKTTRVFACLPA